MLPAGTGSEMTLWRCCLLSVGVTFIEYKGDADRGEAAFDGTLRYPPLALAPEAEAATAPAPEAEAAGALGELICSALSSSRLGATEGLRRSGGTGSVW